MSKGLRTYAIDFGIDETLKDGDKNTVEDVFFPGKGMMSFYGLDNVDILTAALNDDEFEAIAERGLDIMRFLDELDANPQDFFFFQLENVDTEQDIMRKFRYRGHWWLDNSWSKLEDIGVGIVDMLLSHEPAIFWGNDTWWCAYVHGKFILSENVGKIDQARIKNDSLQQKLVSNISSDESNVILAFLYDKHKT